LTLRDRLRRLIPSREQLEASRFTRWLAPWLGERQLWRWSRRGVALGVGVGIFFGLLVPLAQPPLSVAAAIALRANVPAAFASTLVTNPVTFAPIYYLAWKTGARLMGDASPQDLAEARRELAGMASAANAGDPDAAKPLGTWQRVRALGKPLLVGLALFAVAGGLLSYALIWLGWWLAVRLKRRRRARSAHAQHRGTL